MAQSGHTIPQRAIWLGGDRAGSGCAATARSGITARGRLESLAGAFCSVVRPDPAQGTVTTAA